MMKRRRVNMRGKTQWNERPHFYLFEDQQAVSICRLAPGETDLTLEWLDGKSEGRYYLEWKAMYTGDSWQRREVQGYEARIEGLTPWREYEVRVVRMCGEACRIRYFRTGFVPGTVINYLHPHDDRYAFSGHALCSPNLIKLPSGKLLASMDLYTGRGPQNLTLLFKSEDRGKTWHYVCDLFPLFWGKMFYHNGRLYMLGCSTEFGDVLIGASDDEGENWTAPSHLFAGANTVGDGWEQSPMPVLTHNGRIYVAMEYAGRNINRRPTVLSAPEDADLLDPASWNATKPYLAHPAQLGIPGSSLECFIEGNLYVSPAGELLSMWRVDADGIDPTDGKAAVLKVDETDPDASLVFSHFAAMPVGYNNKFMLLYDEVSGYYVAIGNLWTDKNNSHQRNVLALLCSKDAENWTVCSRILDYPNEQTFEVGFQYPSFLFDGDDILLQVRTATNGAHNFHDANYSTFHIIPNFRALLHQ